MAVPKLSSCLFAGIKIMVSDCVSCVKAIELMVWLKIYSHVGQDICVFDM